MFRFSGLPLENFVPLFGESEAALAEKGISRVRADEKPGYPCRITLEDAEPGEMLLLLPYEHQPANSPYRSSGPIFVREGAREKYAASETPPVLRGRLLSLRAYDAADLIVDADVVEGNDVEDHLRRLFAREDTAYVHIHNARRGCYSCRVDRV
jgi:hypothetical protein